MGIIISLIILTGVYGFYYTDLNEDKVVDFIRDNPEKSSILMIRNDSIMASQNITKVMPLASTVKIIIAIEYSIQSAGQTINPDELIPLDELRKFYVPNTDGGAHPAWLKSVESKISESKISIREIAKGMIKYSSNANTEWLLNRLGIDNVNNRLDSLGLKNHTQIYNIVSALFVGKELFPESTGQELKIKLSELSKDKYISAANDIHFKLLTDTLYKNEVGEMNMDMQKIWSDNLPASTVEDYVSIMKKLNSRSYFNPKIHGYLDEVMEYILENPVNREWLEHSGMKGGSTAFVLTKALYATDKKGNRTELACFFNELSFLEMTRLRMSMNEFEMKLLTNAAFREKLKSGLLR